MAGSERTHEATAATAKPASATDATTGTSSSAGSAAVATAPSSLTAAAPATSQSSGPGQRGRSEEGLGGSSGAASAQASLVEGLQCNLLMNARYHASREAFLDTVHRVLMFSIIVLGAAAVTDLLNAPWIKGAFAACAVIFASFDLTADLSNRARQHALMKRRYFDLLADLAANKKSAAEIEEHMHRCSADEEPAFHALLAVSWNAAQEMVYGDHAYKYQIPRLHRLLKNIRRYGQENYRPAPA
jgi:hypothetical protein